MSLIQDLTQILTTVLPTDPSFRTIGRKMLDRHIAMARAHAVANAKDDFLLSLMRLLALPENGHTRLIPNGAISVLPLRFATIGAAVRLLNPPPDSATAAGGELLSINGLPTGEIETRAGSLLAGTAPRKRVIGPILFVWPHALRHLGVWSAGDAIDYQIRSNSGLITNLRLDPANTVPAATLYPRSEHGRADPAWSPTAFLTVKDFGTAGAFLGLPSFFDAGDTALSEAISKAAALVASRPDSSLLLDLRGNTGGDFLRTMPLIDAIAHGAEHRRVAVLVDKFTFSAAIVFVAILKHRLKDRLLLIGEEMGDGLTFFAEGGTIDLPGSGAVVRYSSAFHDWAGGQTDETTPPEIAENLVPVGALRIDRPWVGGDPPDSFCLEVLTSLNS